MEKLSFKNTFKFFLSGVVFCCHYSEVSMAAAITSAAPTSAAPSVVSRQNSGLVRYNNYKGLKIWLFQFRNHDVESIIPSAEKVQFEADFTFDNVSNLFKPAVKALSSFKNLPSSLDLKDPSLRSRDDNRPPNQEQYEAIKNVVLSTKKLTIVEGVPGSGKTSGVLKWVLGIAKSKQPGVKVYLSAPNAGGMKAIAKDFEAEAMNGAVKILEFDKITTDSSLQQDAVVLIDECYMMNKDQLSALLQLAKEKNWRIIFSGDSQQDLPKDTIYGMLAGFPTFRLTSSFRAAKGEDRGFVKKYGERKSSDDHRNALKIALQSLLVTSPAIEKIEPVKNSLMAANNAFLSFDQKKFPNAHIVAISYWAKYYKDKSQLDKIMIIADVTDKKAVTAELISRGLEAVEVEKIVKTSSESQGAGCDYVAVLLSKKMTESNIYVALSRHKQEVLIFVPVGDDAEHFKSANDAIEFQYASDQRKADAKERFKSSVRKIIQQEKVVKD